MRDVTLNAHYIFAFKNPRDRTQIQHLVRQVAPHDWRRVRQMFEIATRNPHTYLLFDVRQATEEPFRYRTDLVWGARNNCAVIFGGTDDESTEEWLNSFR
jgi:G3E family GTPase